MMVERSPYIGEFLKNLDQATSKIKEINEEQRQGQEVSQAQLQTLIKAVQNCNRNLAAGSLEDKKFVPEEMKESLENALLAIDIFQGMHPKKTAVPQKGIQQAIVSQFATLAEEINLLKRNLGDLKKYRIGQRVEKSQQGKKS